MGLMPKATRAETKMAFGLSFQKFFGIILTLMLSTAFSSYVHASFHILFIIACFVFFALLNMKAPHNPKRTMWQGMLVWLAGIFAPRVYLSVIGYAYKEALEVNE